MLTTRVEIRPRYVHVVCSGTIDVNEFVAALHRGLESASSSGRRAVVMDALGVGGTLSTVERFTLGDDITHAQRVHGYAAVIAVVANEPPLEPERFAEKVAINRGAIGKAFLDLPEAERWIEDRIAKFSSRDPVRDS